MYRIWLAAATAALLSSAARADDVKLPKAVAQAIKATFPNTKVVGVDKDDEDGQVQYEVLLRSKAGTLEAVLTAKGKVVKVEMKGAKDDDDEKAEGKKGGDKDEAKKAAAKGKSKKDDGDDKKAATTKKAPPGKGGKKADDDDDDDKKGSSNKSDDKGKKGGGKDE